MEFSNSNGDHIDIVTRYFFSFLFSNIISTFLLLISTNSQSVNLVVRLKSQQPKIILEIIQAIPIYFSVTCKIPLVTHSLSTLTGIVAKSLHHLLLWLNSFLFSSSSSRFALSCVELVDLHNQNQSHASPLIRHPLSSC